MALTADEVAIATLRRSLTDADVTLSLLQRHGPCKRKQRPSSSESDEGSEEEEAATQGSMVSPVPVSCFTQGFPAAPDPVTQGVPAAPDPELTSASDEVEAMTQGAAAEPRIALRHRRVRVAFTGVRDRDELQRLRRVVLTLDGDLEPEGVISSDLTHLVVSPAVGARRTAKSVWAALSKKILVGPAWVDECERRGHFAEELEDVPASDDDQSGPQFSMSVRGVANPIDRTRVCITEAFRRQHAANRLCAELLTTTPVLLKEAKVVSVAEGAERVFAADSEAAELKARLAAAMCHAQVCTWEEFLDQHVPGHSRRRLLPR